MLQSNININEYRNEPIQDISCVDIVKRFEVAYTESEYFLQVGEIIPKAGWILHLSVIRSQFERMVNIVIPFLIKSTAPFIIVKNRHAAKLSLDGSLGYTQIGKLASIYVRTDEELLQVTKDLIDLTSQLTGPAIPTDILLRGIIYTLHADYDMQGIYHCNIPFKYPKGVYWPFGDITQPLLPEQKALWNYRYKPFATIKHDPKGRVLKANYFKGFFNIKLCVIKEGIKNIWSDAWGRDIIDRLKWQYELYNDLSGEIATPRIFDLFYENGNAYLVMEFIKGEKLEDKIASIYKDKSWRTISEDDKLSLIKCLLNVIKLIKALHNKGYLHRDITPANFIVDKKDCIYLIDLELCYSFKHNKPNPAFKLGTPGYASPEQLEHRKPTIKEDIFALGALMVLVFTGLPPVKFDDQAEEKRFSSLLFFIEDHDLADLISKCLCSNWKVRPSLDEIQIKIEELQKKISLPPTLSEYILLPDEIEKVIDEALAGLVSSRTSSELFLWKSLKIQQDYVEGYQPIERAVRPGLYAGIPGILYLIARAKKMGYSIESCIPSYEVNWKHVKDNFLSFKLNIKPGLFDGLAGISLAINEGIYSGLLDNEECKLLFKQCFLSKATDLTLSNGIAGQGLALLQCRTKLDAEFVEQLLQDYIFTILEQQEKDGSWNTLSAGGKKNEKVIGFAHGVSGILYFLIAYSMVYEKKEVTVSIQKGLNWLIKIIQHKKNNYFWTTTTRSKRVDKWTIITGIPGIALVFIKAYEWSNNSLYKEIIENVLNSLPNIPVHVDFTQAYGLAGIGEVYLEASRIFKTIEWKKRSDWLANFFVHTAKGDNGCKFWSVNIYPNSEYDLMTGSSGIIHYLMRYQKLNQLPYILSSTENK